MKYVKNNYTNGDTFFHSSQKGLDGEISPDHNNPKKKRDFGDGFYLGNKPNQTIALVNSCPDAKLYEIRIPKGILNKENTIKLTKMDWMYFVLYNRGYLNPIKGTPFYEHYAHLADGKQFIVGAIADDVYATCMKDFAVKGIITDYAFMQLIDCYSYGIQIVAKTEEACRQLEIYSEKILTAEDRMDSLQTRKFSRAEQEVDYERRRAALMIERKGQFIGEIFENIRQGKVEIPAIKNPSDSIEKEKKVNIKFESPIHDERGDDDEYEYFR